MKLYHKNPRQITKQQYIDLEAWLDELGDLSGIVHDLNSDEIPAGNQRSRVFGIIKDEGNIVITETLDEPTRQGTVARGYIEWHGERYGYRQVRWTPRQCESANIIANRAGGGWDFDILANEFEFSDLLDWGFDEATLLGAGWELEEEPPPAPEAQMDRAEELQEKWRVASGDLWEIGEHRLICGDCTDGAVVERVMGGEKASLCITSPPYWLGKDYEREQTRDEVTVLQIGTAQSIDVATRADEGRVVLVTGTYWKSKIDGGRPEFGLLLDEWVLALREQEWIMRHARIWAKRAALPHTNPNSDLVDTHWEFVATFYKPNAKYRGQQRCGEGWAQQGIWNGIHGEMSSHGHVAAYPVEIPKRNIILYSCQEEVIFDPFLGSGTTMVAAQNLERRCLGIEVHPPYCSVTLERMSQMGLEPKRL